MENLIGKKVKGFKYGNIDGLTWSPTTEQYIGKVGTIERRGIFYNKAFIVTFEEGEKDLFPESMISDHLVVEKEAEVDKESYIGLTITGFEFGYVMGASFVNEMKEVIGHEGVIVRYDKDCDLFCVRFNGEYWWYPASKCISQIKNKESIKDDTDQYVQVKLSDAYAMMYGFKKPEEVFDITVLVKGDWYKISREHGDIYMLFEGNFKEDGFNKGFDVNGRWYDRIYVHKSEVASGAVKPADMSDVYTLLIKEAKNRGFIEGAMCNSILYKDVDYIISHNGIEVKNGGLYMDLVVGVLVGVQGACKRSIYNDGEWAKVYDTSREGRLVYVKFDSGIWNMRFTKAGAITDKGILCYDYQAKKGKATRFKTYSFTNPLEDNF